MIRLFAKKNHCRVAMILCTSRVISICLIIYFLDVKRPYSSTLFVGLSYSHALGSRDRQYVAAMHMGLHARDTPKERMLGTIPCG
ncbi:hypothetical protein IG631_12901 [Alternaria alternata]|nr:hypothetical protein IG631_12901 [Alternaria alternata]